MPPQCSVAGVTVENLPRTDSALTQIVSELPTFFLDGGSLPGKREALPQWCTRRRQATLFEHNILLCRLFLPSKHHLRIWCLPSFYEGLALRQDSGVPWVGRGGPKSGDTLPYSNALGTENPSLGG